MFDELKGKIAELFDRGDIETLPDDLRESIANQPRLTGYYNQLKVIDDGLRSSPAVAIPSGFVAAVLRMLPSEKFVVPRLFRLRDLLLPVYVVIVLVMSVLFAEQIGLTALFEMMTLQMSATNEAGLQLIFVVVSSAGILFTLWLIVNSFFGIRSRRVVK